MHLYYHYPDLHTVCAVHGKGSSLNVLTLGSDHFKSFRHKGSRCVSNPRVKDTAEKSQSTNY